MSKHIGVRAKWWAARSAAMERLLFALSAYALPIAIGLLSLVALTAWEPRTSTEGNFSLAFRALHETGESLSAAQAARDLEALPRQTFIDTKRSESGFWLLIEPKKPTDSEPSVIELPSRHAVDVACWNAATLEPLGRGRQDSSLGAISSVKSGFAVNLAMADTPPSLLCRVHAVGPARLTAMQWPASELQISAQEFNHNEGLLTGGLVVLALFVLVTALINRTATYLLFATWLLLNLRVAALSAGWDGAWLGHLVPQELLWSGRALTMALYYTVTITLFKTLFADDLEHVGNTDAMRVAQWTCLPLLVASLVIPYGQFLPVIWVATGVSTGLLIYLLVRILMKTRSRVAMWYGGSIVITLFASVYEVVSAALGLQALIGTVNSVTAALSSSLLASLAIAEQMRQEHLERMAVQAELAHTYEAMPIGLFTLDTYGNFVSANPALRRMLAEDVLTPGSRAWQRHFSEGAWMQLLSMVHQRSDGELELKGLTRADNGPVRRYLVKATLSRDKIEGSLQDVTEKSRATEDLQFMANNDALTKVLNRRGIEKVLTHAMQQINSNRPLALAYLDLDRFKLINDLYGHGAGDEVLQQVCKRISDMLSGGMQIGRVGGDEFIIVLPDTRIPLASVICQGVVARIGATPYHIKDKAFQVRASVGLIDVDAGVQIKDAVSAADRACRQAKAGSGHNGLVVYEKNAEAFRQHEAELELVERFSTNSATDGLFLEMQPIMSLTAPHESLNFEVLLRMRDASGQRIPTDRVISAGESSGHMGVIDRWVLSTTLAWLNTHASKLQSTRFVCVNLSGASLNDETFMQDVFAMLAQNIHITGRLCLEITESVALHDLENTRRFIDKIRSYGAKVALDDFGAGYTSFSYLKVLSADLLKIDGSFIVNMNKHPANIAIVEAIVSLARNLGMKTIAEWAEDNATVQTLAEIGVDYVQGFAVARPRAPEQMLEAQSSASFIEDEALRRMTELLGKADDELLQVSLFDASRPRNMH